MKDKIKEVELYFKNKLLSGDFKIRDKTEYTFLLLVDNEYSFTVWINNSPEARGLYHSVYNFMGLTLTRTEKIKLHGILYKDIRDYKKGVLKKEKLKKFNKLKKDLNL